MLQEEEEEERREVGWVGRMGKRKGKWKRGDGSRKEGRMREKAEKDTVDEEVEEKKKEVQ